MQSRAPAAVRISKPPILAMWIFYPAALFAAVLFTDVAYWRTADPLWTTMSSWLLLVSLVMAAPFVLTDLIGLLQGRGVRSRLAWVHTASNAMAFLLSALNFVFHVRDGYSAVIPAGPLLSVAVVLLLLFASWTGLSLVHRHQVAVATDNATAFKEF